jgi:hypothetical protein
MKFATPLKFGLLGGICAVIINLIIYLINPASMNGGAAYLLYVPLLFCMIYGGITYRKENNDELSFGKSFIAVWIIALVGSMMLNAFTSIVLMKIIDPTLEQKMIVQATEKAVEQWEKAGMTDDMIEQNKKMLEKFDFKLIGLISSFVIGLILSLIIALFVKRNPEKITPVSESN